MSHPSYHLLAGAIAFAVVLAIFSFTLNRLVKRKLRLSIYFLLAYAALHSVLDFRPELTSRLELVGIERVLLTAALINLFVVALLNPLRADRVPLRFPSIVQDAIVIGLLFVVSTFILGDQFQITSAASAVVVGFALQDTLGNAFAGLAIQSEKPFNIGHWISVGDHQGRVAEVTWRATKMRTKTGNFVILPNSEVAKAAITNYSQPAAPLRLYVDVGVTYDALPNTVKAVVKEALANCPLVLKAPAPDAMIHDFAGSAITYRVRFWTEDAELDEEAMDQVRSSLYYAFKRQSIEIPYPIQVEISKDPPVADDERDVAERALLLAAVDLFASLDETQRATIAAETRSMEFGDGETIVQEGDSGRTMYIVVSGAVAVKLESTGTIVATIKQGGYFGEMSLLTGDPRTASVVACGDVRVLELDVEVFRRMSEASPQIIEQIGVAAATRRAELNAARDSARMSAVVEAPATLLARMRRFWGGRNLVN